MQRISEMKEKTETETEDPNFKRQRFECKKAVNNNINKQFTAIQREIFDSLLPCIYSISQLSCFVDSD